MYKRSCKFYAPSVEINARSMHPLYVDTGSSKNPFSVKVHFSKCTGIDPICV